MDPKDGSPDPANAETFADSQPAATTRPRGEIRGYELGDVIGRGGMGEVVVARDPEMDRDVAIKRMRSTDSSTVERFLREAKIQARLDHPAIVPIHELGRDADGNPYFTMKRVTGVTLASLLAGQRPPLSRLLRVFVEVCQAIEYAHARNIVHRDLKPANIMVGDYGEVYVLDWGVARIVVAPTTMRGADFKLDDAATRLGTILGTPGYMAPEQARGDVAGPAADVYALGAILFEILAGATLHPIGERALDSTRETPQVSPARRHRDREIAPELDGACFDALAPVASKRPTAKQLAERIQRYLDGDRDLERRREMAAAALASARTALATDTPDARATAIRRAGRAVALDPESKDATQLLASLIVEPPAVLPRVLVDHLEQIERAKTKRRSASGLRAQAVMFAVAASMPLMTIESWPWFAALCALLVTTILRLWQLSRTGEANPYVMLALYFLFGLAWSRFAGPFVLLPAIVCGLIVGMSGSRWLQDRPWALVVWVAATLLVPFGLEWAGLVEQTVWIGDAIVSRSQMVHTDGPVAAVVLIAVNVVSVTTAGMMALARTRAARVAEHELEIRAWQLRQLVPAGERRTTHL